MKYAAIASCQVMLISAILNRNHLHLVATMECNKIHHPLQALLQQVQWWLPKLNSIIQITTNTCAGMMAKRQRSRQTFSQLMKNAVNLIGSIPRNASLISREVKNGSHWLVAIVQKKAPDQRMYCYQILAQSAVADSSHLQKIASTNQSIQ
jgi:hypothetical protein